MAKKLTTQDFIERANKIHENKYDYSKVGYKNVGNYITIICPDHGEFKQKVQNHLNGNGCKKCAVEKRIFTTEKFINLSKKIHKNKYDYSKVDYMNSKSKVIIICSKHGEFKQIPANHLMGQECKKCALKKRTISVEKFINLSKQTHNNKYDYSKIKNIKANEKIIIICPEHGEFLQRARSHINGSGCKKCIVKSRSGCLENFVIEAKKIHNNKYDYSKTKYINNHTKGMIICPEHGIFFQTPANHLNGQNCPRCVCSGRSQKADKWLDIVNIFEENREFSIILKNGNKIIVDGYNKNTNTIYEYFGDYWHGNPKIYSAHDINKKNNKTFGQLYDETIERVKSIIDNGYFLIYKWETNFNMGIGDKYEED